MLDYLKIGVAYLSRDQLYIFSVAEKIIKNWNGLLYLVGIVNKIFRVWFMYFLLFRILLKWCPKIFPIIYVISFYSCPSINYIIKLHLNAWNIFKLKFISIIVFCTAYYYLINNIILILGNEYLDTRINNFFAYLTFWAQANSNLQPQLLQHLKIVNVHYLQKINPKLRNRSSLCFERKCKYFWYFRTLFRETKIHEYKRQFSPHKKYLTWSWMVL